MVDQKKKTLLDKLNSEYSFNISLKGYLLKNVQKKILSNYSFKSPGYINLEFYDTFTKPRILYSKKNNVSDLPNLSINEVPAWEAWRLLINRMGDLLDIFSKKLDNMNVKNNYCWLKSFEAAAISYLIVKKKYLPSIDSNVVSFDKSILSEENELDALCKESFVLLRMAINARQKHDISIFDISNFTDQERFKILNSWMTFIQNIMIKEENILVKHDVSIWRLYLKNKQLQNKYLETNFYHNIIFSNILRLLCHSSLLNNKYKFYNLKDSWRHVILLTLASAFKEYSDNNLKFNETKQIIRRIIKSNYVNSLNGVEFLKLVVFYWKMLRF